MDRIHRPRHYVEFSLLHNDQLIALTAPTDAIMHVMLLPVGALEAFRQKVVQPLAKATQMIREI